MAQRPSFGTLKKAKPAPEAVTAPAHTPAPVTVPPSAPAPESKPGERIQTSVRLEPALWAALSELATRKRIETGRRVTVRDLMIEGARHILALNGSKASE